MIEFNIYSAPLLIGFLQGLVYAILLFRRSFRDERSSDRWLAWLLILGCTYIMQYMLGFGGWYDSHDWRSTFMFYFPFFLLVLVGPVMYFYFRSLSNHHFQFRRKDIGHFIPGVAVLILYLAIFLHDVIWDHWMEGHAFPLHFGTQGRWSKFRQDYVPLVPIGLLSTIVYTVFTIRVYNRYRRYLVDNFSATEGIRFGWLRLLLYAIILALAVNWGVQLLDLAIEVSYQQFWTSHFAFALMVYILAIQGYDAPLRAPNDLQFEPADSIQAEEKTKELEEELGLWKIRLQKYMVQEKPFLEPQLTLRDLAQRLQTNASVLSKVINTGFDQNFNDFINDFRIQAVQEQLRSGAAQHFTFMSIALDCGFNSKATFNRAFRKQTGMSPREFLDKEQVES